MKIYSIAVFIVVCMLPLQVLPFIFKASRWEKNEKSITLLSDVHLPVKDRPERMEWDEKHVVALIQYLSAKQDCTVIVEDECKTVIEKEKYVSKFLPGLATTLRGYGINAHAVDFRSFLNNLSEPNLWNESVIVDAKSKVLGVLTRITPQIPHAFHESFEMIKNDLEKHSSIYKVIFDKYGTYAKKVWFNEVELLCNQLFDFVLLAEINEKTDDKDHIFVCAGAKHIKVLEHAFRLDGYTHVAKVRSIDNFIKAQRIAYKGFFHCMPVDLKKALEYLDNNVSGYAPLDSDLKR